MNKLNMFSGDCKTDNVDAIQCLQFHLQIAVNTKLPYQTHACDVPHLSVT